MSTPASPEKPPLELLKGQIQRGEKVRARVPIPLGEYAVWVATIRHYLFRIYGMGASQIDLLFPTVNPKALFESKQDVNPLAAETARRLKAIVSRLDDVTNLGPGGGGDGKVFIGHGRSPVWRELKDFLHDTLGLPWDEFNKESVAGLPTFVRLEEMLSNARFAFLVMTAEEEDEDEKLHARENVVHELGLFQGHLGPRKAIILLENECAEFSNIVGLSQIRFPKGHISACYEQIRGVLQREGLIKS
jgi:hypothetical protein